MLVTPVHTMLVGIAPPPDPDTPRIMAEAPVPPRNGNPGVVPPWLQNDGNAR